MFFNMTFQFCPLVYHRYIRLINIQHTQRFIQDFLTNKKKIKQKGNTSILSILKVVMLLKVGEGIDVVLGMIVNALVSDIRLRKVLDLIKNFTYEQPGQDY